MGCTYCVPYGKKGAFPRNGSFPPRTLREENRKTTSPESLGRSTPTADEREVCGLQERTGLRYFRMWTPGIEILWRSHNSFKFAPCVCGVQPRHGGREYGCLCKKTATKTKLVKIEYFKFPFLIVPHLKNQNRNFLNLEKTTLHFRFLFLIC